MYLRRKHVVLIILSRPSNGRVDVYNNTVVTFRYIYYIPSNINLK